MRNRLKTEVSRPYWCEPDHGDFNFKPASVDLGSHSGYMSWFDVLFEGGVVIPAAASGETERALTILLSGPPGTGKSTLAMELCYRLARPVIEEERTLMGLEKERLTSFFITTEATALQLKEKAKSFAWPHVEDLFVNIRDFKGKAHSKVVYIWEIGRFEEGIETQLPRPYQWIVATTLKWARVPDRKIEEIVKSDNLRRTQRAIGDKLGPRGPDILVIDSLNTMPEEERPELFKRFMDLTMGPKVVVMILDSSSHDSGADFWEYVSDVVVSLDKSVVSDYLVRTIEIKKARHQSHVWGTHQLKIYGRMEPENMERHERRRAHPYRREGGIFIYPSIHFYLSSYKRQGPLNPPQPVGTPIEELNRILKGGFPKGRCTAFIGKRGGHKSHLAYLHLLGRIIEDQDEGGIVISLRDDEGMAKRTMGSIMDQQLGRSQNDLDDLINSGRLDILYYPPGYITPEEFYHRIYLSVQRMKKRFGRGNTTLVFNSLDQLASRFPLCAREDIFVPGIIETLTAEEVTSICIAVEEPGQPPEQYGLLSMADLILKFEQLEFSMEQYCQILSRWIDCSRQMDSRDLDEIRRSLPVFWSAVVMTVVRYAGGQAAGGGGILELVESSSDIFSLYGEPRLFFVPELPSTFRSIRGQDSADGSC